MAGKHIGTCKENNLACARKYFQRKRFPRVTKLTRLRTCMQPSIVKFLKLNPLRAKIIRLFSRNVNEMDIFILLPNFY